MKILATLLFSAAAITIIAFNCGVSAAFGIDEEFMPYYPFFPYGKGFDYVLTDPPNYIFTPGDEDNGLFGVFLEKRFPLFHRVDNQLIFISTNGYVAFGDSFYSNKAEKFPVSTPILSAFHTDLKFTNSKDSHLSFGEFSEGHPKIMLHAKHELFNHGVPASFQPNHVVCITWQNAHTKNGKLTFQIVITTDGYNTYITFNYKDMNLDKFQFNPVTIGWQSDDKNYFQHENMQLSPAYKYRPTLMQGKSKSGIDGKWIYHLFATNFADANKPIISPEVPPEVTDVSNKCPKTADVCSTAKQTLIGVVRHPHIVAVCERHDRPPVCIPCAQGHFFVQACKTCVKVLPIGGDQTKTAEEQLALAEGKCREESETLPTRNRAERLGNVCNKELAAAFCKLNDPKHRYTVPIRMYRNIHDVNSKSFIWCWNSGSSCMNCGPGTGFFELNEYSGICKAGKNKAWFDQHS